MVVDDPCFLIEPLHLSPFPFDGSLRDGPDLTLLSNGVDRFSETVLDQRTRCLGPRRTKILFALCIPASFLASSAYLVVSWQIRSEVLETASSLSPRRTFSSLNV